MRPAESDGDVDSAFVVVPKSASKKLPRRGKTTVVGTVDSHDFQATLEPDGRLSQWMRVDNVLLEAIDKTVGDMVAFEIMSVEKEPEPDIPADMQAALAAQAASTHTSATRHRRQSHWAECRNIRDSARLAIQLDAAGNTCSQGNLRENQEPLASLLDAPAI